MSTAEEKRPEDIYPEYIEHKNEKYLFEKYLGKGAFGFVFLYHSKDDISKKLAIKVENKKAALRSGNVMTKETYYLRILNEKGCDRVIGYYGDSFV